MSNPTIVANDCYYELPNLSIDYLKLWRIWYSHRHLGCAYNSPDYGVLPDTDRIDMNLYKDSYCQQLIQSINTEEKIFEKFIWFRGGFELWPHKDEARKASIIIPMFPVPQQPAYWYDDNSNLITSVVIDKPTLYNVEIYHNFYCDGQDRLNFHISLYESYHTLLDKAKNGQLIR
jgi:hypothetical protein